jgi:hypothetical protein
MTSQQPGRLPASVYRRRRLVVGLGVLAVIVVIVLLIVRPGAGADDTKKPGASDNPSANSSETPKADDSAPCDPASLVVTPVTDKESYQPGETPMISMTVKNGGAAACTVDLDATKQLYQIVSGSDPIWNSADCQTDAAKPFPQVLEPAQVLPLPAIPWDRTRSSADTCDAERPQVTAGGATYRLTVSLGEATSAGDVAFLLF